MFESVYASIIDEDIKPTIAPQNTSHPGNNVFFATYVHAKSHTALCIRRNLLSRFYIYVGINNQRSICSVQICYRLPYPTCRPRYEGYFA